jgi:predicted membrane protein (TIGR00267 family)
MKSARKIAKHLSSPEQHTKINWLRDVILGGQDGLVNVLGIVLGVSAASGDNKILIAASMAAAFAEAVSMGAVAYTSTLTERDHYLKELERETLEVENSPEAETQEVREIYAKKGFSGDLLEKIVSQVTSNKENWVKIMMDEELGLEDVDTKKIILTSLVVALAALLAAFIPIIPFMFLPHTQAVVCAIAASCVSLFAIGIYEAKTYVGVWWKKGLQMTVIGLGAALVGFLIGRLFGT